MHIPIEILQIYNTIIQYPPFSSLSPESASNLAKKAKTSYHRNLEEIDSDIIPIGTLIFIRKGAIEIKDLSGQLLDKISIGDSFVYRGLAQYKYSFIDDTLLYCFDQEVVEQVKKSSSNFTLHFSDKHSKRLREAIRQKAKNYTYTQAVNQLMTREVITVNASCSIQEAAQLMSEHRISSLVVVQKDSIKPQPIIMGIVTDKDLRNRVVITGSSFLNPIGDIVTPNPITIEPEAFIDQAIIKMIEKDIHHLPVVVGLEPVGMISMTDIIQQQKTEPILIISSIHKAKSADELVDICEEIPALLKNLISANVTAESLGRILTTVTDTLTQRLIILAKEKLGDEPVPFTWLAFGSQGRCDQSAKSDQDNALLLHDQVKPEDDEYFKALATFVCDGLNACGYVYCPGKIMATNQQWRQPLSKWLETFNHWISQPEPKAMMHCSIFFDLRAVYESKGASLLKGKLHKSILSKTQNQIFLRLLTENALKLRPPIGFFRRFVLNRSGSHKNTLDIKLKGLMPITDIVRTHSLANGINQVNTVDRLKALVELGVLTKTDTQNLIDAYEFISHIRIVHQGKQMIDGQSVDNHLDPKELSELVKHQLKDAFKVVGDAQKGLILRYATDLS